MRKLGLDVHLEPVQARHWIRGAESAELVEYPGQAPGTTQKIVLTALGGNRPTPPGGITAEVVVANSFADLDRLGRQNVAGRIVLFNVVFDKQKAAGGYAGEAYEEAVAYRALGAQKAAALGAAASLVRSVGGADYRLPHTGGSHAANIPAGAVTSEDADLIAHLSAQGKVRMHVILTSQTAEEVGTFNVVGDLKGSEHPEQVVIVSGHLDSWDLGTGAIDDAAGVAVAMETAHLIQQLHLHPKRTLRVIAWIDEENLGRGHVAYAKAHAAEIGNHVAAIESDLGASHPMGFRAKISAEAAARLQPVLDVLQPAGSNLIVLSSDSPEADIEPLAKQGVPAFGLLQDGRTTSTTTTPPPTRWTRSFPRNCGKTLQPWPSWATHWRRCPTRCPTENHVGTGARPSGGAKHRWCRWLPGSRVCPGRSRPCRNASRPFGARSRSMLPTACAVGFILAPLRGFLWRRYSTSCSRPGLRHCPITRVQQ